MNYPAVRNWLAARASLEPSLLEGPGFDTLVAERIAAAGGGTELGYIAALERSPDEADRLAAGIAVPETWLFRYPESFRLLVGFLGHRLATGAAPLRMLSIGCATGEEPYGMAMAALHAGWPQASIEVRALDRSGGALRRAATGSYGAFSIRTGIPDWAMPFFHRAGDAIVVDPAVRALVDFRQADPLQPDSSALDGRFDVAFCRNVLIYLNAAARARLIGSIGDALHAGGLFFVGHAEPLLCDDPRLRPIPAPHAFALERISADSTRSSTLIPGRTTPRPAIDPSTSRAPVSPPRPRARPKHPSQDLPEPTLENARDLADAGRSADSEAMVRTVIARRGPSAPAMELLGMLRMASNDTATARTLFEQAVYLEPSRATSLLQLAILSERTGDPRRAAILWDRARRASVAGPQEPPG